MSGLVVSRYSLRIWKRVLIDCGAFQGSSFLEAKNFQPFPFDASTIDAVIVTHAHLDHVGRLPKLVKDGFKGKVYLTPPTAKLAKLVLDDAFTIMKEDQAREGRRRKLRELAGRECRCVLRLRRRTRRRGLAAGSWDRPAHVPELTHP